MENRQHLRIIFRSVSRGENIEHLSTLCLQYVPAPIDFIKDTLKQYRNIGNNVDSYIDMLLHYKTPEVEIGASNMTPEIQKPNEEAYFPKFYKKRFTK